MIGHRSLGFGFAAALVSTATAAAFVSASAAGTAVAQKQQQQQQIVIGYTAPTSLPFDKELQKAMALQAKKLGVKLIVEGETFDNNTQVAALNSLIAQHVDGIIAFPINPQSQLPAIDRARKQGIKVISILTPGVKDVLSNIVTNDFAAGEQLAKVGAAAVGGGSKCKVGILEGPPVVPNLQLRDKGYEAGAKAAGCTILDTQSNQADQPATATAIANTWKTKYVGQMNLMLVYNDPAAFGAEAAVDSTFQPKIIGMNGDAPNMQAVRDGRQLADAYQDNEAVGNAAVYATYLAIKGKHIPRLIQSQLKIFTKANVNRYVAAGERESTALKVRFVREGKVYVLKTSR